MSLVYACFSIAVFFLKWRNYIHRWKITHFPFKTFTISSKTYKFTFFSLLGTNKFIKLMMWRETIYKRYPIWLCFRNLLSSFQYMSSLWNVLMLSCCSSKFCSSSEIDFPLNKNCSFVQERVGAMSRLLDDTRSRPECLERDPSARRPLLRQEITKSFLILHKIDRW